MERQWKAGNVSGAKNKQLAARVTDSYVIGNMSVTWLGMKGVAQFQNNVCQCHLQKLEYSTIYSILIKRLWRHLCAQGTPLKINIKCWWSSGPALKTDLILSWKSLHGLRNHCLWTPQHPQMLKLHQAEKKPNVSMIQKHCCVPWSKVHLKWTEAELKTVLRSKFEILPWNHGCNL